MCYTGHSLEVNWEKSHTELAQKWINLRAESAKALRRISKILMQNSRRHIIDFTRNITQKDKLQF